MSNHYVIQRKDTGTYLRSYFMESTWTKSLQKAEIFNIKKHCDDNVFWLKLDECICRIVEVEVQMRLK